MIDSLDLVLRQTVTTAIPALKNRVGFQPPDELWRQRVGAGAGIWLNCALVDLREDRLRRSNEIVVDTESMTRIHAPFLLRCHYLLSVWNSAKDSAAVPASMQEHGMLGRVVAALIARNPLTPSSVLLPTELATLPSAWREAAFDVDLVPPEGFSKIPEFWGTMGRVTPWRPVAWLTVTVPIAPEPRDIDGVVLTILSSLGARGVPESYETLLTVGGTVTDASGGVPEALVLLADSHGTLVARTETDADGTFVLDAVVPGDYTVTARAATHPAAVSKAVDVPAAIGGDIALQFP